MDLRQFQSFMLDEGLSPGTASVYSSAVRKAIDAIGGVDMLTSSAPETVSTSLDRHDQDLPSGQRNTFRSGWRCFERFAATRGLKLPMPRFHDGRRAHEPVPEVLGGPLLALLDYLQPSEIETALWGEVCRSPSGGTALYVKDRGREVEIPRKLLADLRVWSFPRELPNPGAPLLPMVPEGSRPLSTRSIRRTALLAQGAGIKPRKYSA